MAKAKIHTYQSRFDFIQEHARNEWHFDPQLKRADLKKIGRLHGDWQTAIEQARFRPVYSSRKVSKVANAQHGTSNDAPQDNALTWETIEAELLAQLQRASDDAEAADLQWEYMDIQDMKQWGYPPDHIQYCICSKDIPTLFAALSEKLCLEPGQLDLIKQLPGQATYIHTDTRLHEYGLRRIYAGDLTAPNFSRLLIALTPWDWGHYCMIGNSVWHQWDVGDIIVLPWQVVHGTANCGRKPRYFLSITGRETEEHRRWLSSGELKDIFL